MKRLTMLFALLVIVVTQNAWGALPRTISYQGVLTDNVGVIVPNGNYSITFRLYDAASSGTLLWEETQSVLVTSGRYEVILGNIVSMEPLSFDDKYWLTLKVESDSEMDSRVELTGTGYALNARTVEDDAITGSKIADGNVVRSITIPPSNTLRDDVWFKGGTNVTITQVADTLFISATGSGGGNTLDQAYDQGGAGVGRTIDVDAGSVVLDATANGAGNPALRIQGDDLYEPGIELDNNSKTWRMHVQSNGQFGITKGDVFTPLRINENSLNNALVLTNNGVGINTNGPIEMLQVVGALNIGTTANNNPGTIRWTGTDFEGHTVGGWQSLTAGGGDDGDWTVAADNMYSSVTGNVGIGTTGTNAKLDVVTGDNVAGDFTNMGTTDNYTIRGYNTEGTTAAFYSREAPSGYPSTAAVFGKGGSGAIGGFFVSMGDEEGLIGQSQGAGPAIRGWAIGTGYSGYFSGGNGVYVYGDANITRTLIADTVRTTRFKMTPNASDEFVMTSDADGNGRWRPPTSVSDGDWTVSGNDLYSAVSGNIGIGTTNPTFKLDVDGSINCRTIQVGRYLGPGGYGYVRLYAHHFSSDPDCPFDDDTRTVWLTKTSDNAGYLELSAPPAGSPCIEKANVVASTTAGSNGQHGYVGVCDSDGNEQAFMLVGSDGQGYIYYSSATSMTEHPSDPNRDICYGTLEGPESAIYARGTAKLVAGRVEVELPEHFEALASDRGITVMLTPLSADSKGLAVTAKSVSAFTVQELYQGMGAYEFDWEVKAVRRDREDFRPVRAKEERPKVAKVEERVPVFEQ